MTKLLMMLAYWLEPEGTPRMEVVIDTDPTGMGDECWVGDSNG